MGDSSYYALTVNAKQLAAVVIAGAGAGVLTGLSTYELALAAAKQVCVHYLCLTGWVYVFHIGHIDKIMKPFAIF
jgi:hypothetical protein